MEFLILFFNSMKQHHLKFWVLCWNTRIKPFLTGGWAELRQDCGHYADLIWCPYISCLVFNQIRGLKKRINYFPELWNYIYYEIKTVKHICYSGTSAWMLWNGGVNIFSYIKNTFMCNDNKHVWEKYFIFLIKMRGDIFISTYQVCFVNT